MYACVAPPLREVLFTPDQPLPTTTNAQLNTPCLRKHRKYVASLRLATTTDPNFHYCGASLIAPSVVLTAAHCLASSGTSTPAVELGRYHQSAANSSANNYERIQVGARGAVFGGAHEYSVCALCPVWFFGGKGGGRKSRRCASF